METGIRNIVKQSAKFNVVSIISFLIQIPTQLIIGRFLLPKEYGIISLAALWTLYGGLFNPGMLSAAAREVPYLLGKKEEQKAKLIQNISISSDIVWSILPFIVILIASFYYPDRIIRIALLITGINFFLTRLAGYWSTFNFTKQNFTVVAIGKLISVVATPIFIIVAIYCLKIYAVLLAPIFSGLLMFLYYLKRGPIGYHFRWDWKEIKKLAKVGIAFSLSGLIFYGYRMADRTIIAAHLSLTDLGLFTFAMGLIIFAINFLADFGRVLEPILWKNSGANKDTKDTIKSFSIIKRVAVYIALFTAVSIPILQVVYNYVIPLATPNYINSVTVFNVLSLYLYLAALAILPAIVLNSSVVNKQNKITFLYGIGLGIAVLFDLGLIYLGFGIVTIAIVTVVSQGFVTFFAYCLAQPYLTKKVKEFVLLQSKVLFPFIICILFTIFNSSNFLKTGIVPQAVISLFLQVLIWTLIISLFYRKYFPKKQIVEIWNNFTTYFRTAILKK